MQRQGRSPPNQLSIKTNSVMDVMMCLVTVKRFFLYCPYELVSTSFMFSGCLGLPLAPDVTFHCDVAASTSGLFEV
jgi:hypothetical protein